MIKEAISKIWTLFKGTGRFGYLLIGLAAIFSIAYLFGYPLLVGEIKGNDSFWAMTMVAWINRWWPRLPLWFPLQGGGISFIQGYPILGSLATVLTYQSGVTGLSLFQTFRLFQFLSVPLAAVSIYLLVWTRFKNQTVALISGVLSLLSAAIWFWLTQFGFYAQMFSLMFFPLTFLCFDGYLDAVLDKSSSLRQRRFWLIGAAVTFALTTFAHLTTGIVLGGSLVLYTFLRSWGRGLLRGMGSLFMAVILGLGTISFWFLGFFRYFAYAGRDIGLNFGPDQLRVLSLDPLVILGFKTPGLISMWDNLFLARVVVILGGVGLVWSFFRKRKVFYLGLVAIACAFFTTIPQFAPGLVAKYFLLPYSVVYVRAMLGAMLLLPIVAGFGAYAIPDLIGLFLGRILPPLKKRVLGRDLLALLLASLTLVIALFAIPYLRQPPPLLPSGSFSLEFSLENYSGYGPSHGEDYQRYLRFEKEGEFPAITWPQWKIEEPILGFEGYLEKGIREIDEAIGSGQGKRIDISPNLGAHLETLNIYTDHSTINAYAYGASLIHALWGHQAGAFYSDLYGDEETVSNLSKWFGLQAVVLHTGEDPLEKFPEDKWSVLLEKAPSNLSIQVRGFKEAHPMAELSSQPLVLVVGDFKKGAYETVFRLGTDAGFPFDEAWLIDGGSRIDRYSLADLSQFDGVFLYGHQYRNEVIWDRLENYVKQGGRLFIETGWQYASPDWELDVAPDVFPVTGTSWGNLGKSSNYSISENFVSKVDLTQFGPLIWSDQPWSLSLPKEVKSWAFPILEAEGKPLIIGGDYGEGKVLWSGMNFIGHLRTYEKEINPPKDQSEEEMKFFKELMGWWFADLSFSEAGSVRISRDFPDEVRLGLPSDAGGRMLLWREAYHPDWRARLILRENGREIFSPAKVFPAGPGWMSVYIPEGKTVTGVDLSYSTGLFGSLTWGISILAWLIIGLIFLDGLFGGALSARIHLGEKMAKVLKAIPMPKFSLNIRGWLGSEQDNY